MMTQETKNKIYGIIYLLLGSLAITIVFFILPNKLENSNAKYNATPDPYVKAWLKEHNLQGMATYTCSKDMVWKCDVVILFPHFVHTTQLVCHPEYETCSLNLP